jgi:type II secretory pathway pseudopilin PulG
MMPRRARNGFTMVETLLFLGILSIMGTVIVGVILSTQEARVRQQGIAALEQRGTQVLQSRNNHRAPNGNQRRTPDNLRPKRRRLDDDRKARRIV